MAEKLKRSSFWLDKNDNGYLLIPYKTRFNDTMAVYTPYNAVLAEDPYCTGLDGGQR